ncbi:MAG: segregation/condensation protein A [Bacteroidia bacterium]|nr:segregation/condensation protein A [Bacteroidia bacterium]MDW8345393.1 segregation/condensation protein A [Bacteroidia bacterium]
MDYKICLPVFEGPFDLLLFFIERDELDIYDIPIHKLTNDFLAYIQEMERKDIELAAEFMIVAATLMSIKVKMLIPRLNINEKGEKMDPREELVNRILEYKRYKLAMTELQLLESIRSEQFNRGFTQKEQEFLKHSIMPEDELLPVNLYTLLKTYKKLLEKHHTQKNITPHTVMQYPYTIETQMEFLNIQLRQYQKLSFIQIISINSHRVFLLFTFLAILQLVQEQKIEIIIGEGYNNFWIYTNTKNTQG